MSKNTEMDVDLLLLAADNSDDSRKKARERILKLSPTQRRDLRAACQRLDHLVEDSWMEELREERIQKRREAEDAE